MGLVSGLFRVVLEAVRKATKVESASNCGWRDGLVRLYLDVGNETADEGFRNIDLELEGGGLV